MIHLPDELTPVDRDCQEHRVDGQTEGAGIRDTVLRFGGRESSRVRSVREESIPIILCGSFVERDC